MRFLNGVVDVEVVEGEIGFSWICQQNGKKVMGIIVHGYMNIYGDKGRIDILCIVKCCSDEMN